MPATPETTEARAIADRMMQFPQRHGSTQYLRQLIYEDSATLAALIPTIEAVPDVDQDHVRAVYNAAAICGGAGEGVGSIHMHALMTDGATALLAAIDVIEGQAKAKANYAEAMQP